MDDDVLIVHFFKIIELLGRNLREQRVSLLNQHQV